MRISLTLTLRATVVYDTRAAPLRGGACLCLETICHTRISLTSILRVTTPSNRHLRRLYCSSAKAGKGRTGLVCATFLLHTSRCARARDALALYGSRRTLNGKGVTIPSQARYVTYYERWLRWCADDSPAGADDDDARARAARAAACRHVESGSAAACCFDGYAFRGEAA